MLDTKPCTRKPLGWSESQLLLLEERNIHIDNTIKPEEEEEEEESPEEEESDEWETEEEDEDFMDSLEDEEEEMLLSPKRSLVDVEGAIPKTILRKLPNSTIRKIIFHVKKNILMLETENYLYENTIEKLEAHERDIDSKRVPFQTDEEFEEFLKKARLGICSSESEEEDEEQDDGTYQVVNPADAIHVSKDSFFEDMTEHEKREAMELFRDVGNVAPENYDVMHHKYGDYVGTAKEKPMVAEIVDETGVKSRLDPKILNIRNQLDEKMNTGTGKLNDGIDKWKGSSRNSTRRTSKDSGVGTEEEDFNMSDAKRLSITDRLRFALEEEDEFIKRFYLHETKALKDETSIQVHIDAHKHAIGVLMQIRRDFRQISGGASGVGMHGKVMADLLVKFRLRMKYQLSVENTRTRISTRKVVIQKKRILEQLKISSEVGRGISHIDYEYLLCESAILESEINGMNSTLQHMKDLTAQFHLVLQDERQMLRQMVVQESKMKRELKRRHELLQNFHETYVRYQQQIHHTSTRLERIAQRMGEFRRAPPQPLDYIKLKANQSELETEIHGMEKKFEDLSEALVKAKALHEKLHKCMPPGNRTIEEENKAWLAQIKVELKLAKRKKTASHSRIKNPKARLAHAKAIGLPGTDPEEDDDDYDDDDDDEPHPTTGLYAKVVNAASARFTMSARKSLMRDKAGRTSEVSPQDAHHVLTQPGRFDRAKSLTRKSMTPVYDHDFTLLEQTLEHQEYNLPVEPTVFDQTNGNQPHAHRISQRTVTK